MLTAHVVFKEGTQTQTPYLEQAFNKRTKADVTKSHHVNFTFILNTFFKDTESAYPSISAYHYQLS